MLTIPLRSASVKHEEHVFGVYMLYFTYVLCAVLLLHRSAAPCIGTILGAPRNLAFCCRVSPETARFAGRDPEALDRVTGD